MTDSIAVLVIPADPVEPCRLEMVPGEGAAKLKACQDLVAGPGQREAGRGALVEVIPVHGRTKDTTLYVNEEGEWECVDDDGNVIINTRITMWLHAGNPALRMPGGNLFAGDVVRGDVVILGYNPRTGETLAVPDDWAQLAGGVRA